MVGRGVGLVSVRRNEKPVIGGGIGLGSVSGSRASPIATILVCALNTTPGRGLIESHGPVGH